MSNIIHFISIPTTTLNKSTAYIGPQPRLNQHHDLDHHSSSRIDLHNPPTLTKATYIHPILPETSTESTSSLSPTLSSSVSSLSSSTSDSSTYPTNNLTLISRNHFYNPIQAHTTLLRVVLQRSLPDKFVLGQWQRLDLKILDEFGMVIDSNHAKTFIMNVSCELLEREGSTTQISTHWQVCWKHLRYDAWTVEETRHMTTCCGFDRAGVGGLEYKVIRRSDDISARVKKTEPTQLYMRIVPTFDIQQTVHALPLVVGPFTVLSNDTNAWQSNTTLSNNNSSDATSQQSLHQHQSGSHSYTSWGSANAINYCQEMYRAFQLGGLDRYFLIKEGWNMGTPGKMWDSALVISDMFIQKIIQQPACFEDLQILDLSAGTGTTGLLIHYVYKHMFSDYRHPSITLTDLPEALPLIYYNKKMNGIVASEMELSVAPLSWGQTNHIRHIQSKAPIDIIIASDILYEPSNFGLLVSTLADLSTKGRTVIYLGYKRRGLKDEEERQFFDRCCEYFDLQVLGYDNEVDGGGRDELDGYNKAKDDRQHQGHDNNNNNNNNNNHHHHHHISRRKTQNDEVGWEARYGKLVKDGTRMDGEGWMGPFARNWRANNLLEKGVMRQPFQQTGVQIYRLVRKLD